MARRQVTGVGAKLDADVKPFVNGMKKAEKATMSSSAMMKKSFTSLNTAVGRLTSGFGALLGIGAFTSLIDSVRDLTKESMSMLDALGKTAKLLGLTAEQLSVYQFAATQSGLTTRQFNTAFQRFNRRVSEARVGTGVLEKTLKELNITTEDSQGNIKSENELFREFADRIADTTNHADRLRFAVSAFDMEGAKMVNMLREGSAGLDAFKAKAKELGIVITQDMVEGAEEFTNQLDVLQKANSITTARLAKEWGEFTLKLEGMLNKIKELILFIERGPQAPETIEELRDKIREYTEELESGEFVHQRLWKSELVEKYKEELARLVKKQEDSAKAAAEQRRQTTDLAKAQKQHTEALKEHEDVMRQLKKFEDEREARQKRLLQEMAKSRKEVLDAEQKNEQLRIKLIKDRKKQLTEQARFERRIAEQTHIHRLATDETYANNKQKMEEELLEWIELRHQQLVQDLEDLEDKKVDAVRKSTEQIVQGPLAQLVERWSDATTALEFATVGWLERSADALADFATSGKLKFKDLANSIIRDLIRIQLKQAAVNMLSSAFSFGVGQFQTAGQYNTTPFSQQTRMLAAQDAAFKQGGGPMTAGRRFILGEKGSEMFSPTASGRADPVRPVGASSMQKNPVKVNIINNGQPADVESASTVFNIEETVVNIIMKNRRKGGILSRELGPASGAAGRLG